MIVEIRDVVYYIISDISEILPTGKATF